MERKGPDLDTSANRKIGATISMADLNSCAPSSDEGGIFRHHRYRLCDESRFVITARQLQFAETHAQDDPGLACSIVEANTPIHLTGLQGQLQSLPYSSAVSGQSAMTP
jgi:hypothetical protein